MKYKIISFIALIAVIAAFFVGTDIGDNRSRREYEAKNDSLQNQFEMVQLERDSIQNLLTEQRDISHVLVGERDAKDGVIVELRKNRYEEVNSVRTISADSAVLLLTDLVAEPITFDSTIVED